MTVNLRDLDPLLLPRPRRLRLTGGRCDRPRRPDGALHVSELHESLAHGPEAYAISVRPGVIEVRASTPAAFQHARATLAQLQRQYRDIWPTLEIEDWPAFQSRGFMLDVSRDRIPTNQHLARLVNTLASLKFNHLQLYTEHTFAYAGHEEVWRDASPITPDEIRALDDVCRRWHVALAANQNCFGHLKRWLQHSRYAPLAETHGTWKFLEWDRSGPFSLCPIDPRSIALVRDWLGQLLPCFRSGLVNIGCDETFDVGQGRSRDEVARRGFATVYFEFVEKICTAAREHGFRPMFWADMALTHPESVPLIPKDVIALAWGYEPDSPFDEWLQRLRSAAIESWVCPGTSAWLSITGRTTERRENIAAAAHAGLARGATGLMLCEWGDQGHLQQWPVTLRAIADGAEAAWSGASDAGLADPRAVALHLFDDESLELAAWLDELGDADLPLRRIGGKIRPDGSREPMRNASALFRDMVTSLQAPLPYDPPALRGSDAWRECLERLERLGDRLARLIPTAKDSTSAMLRLTTETAIFAAFRAVARRDGSLRRDVRGLISRLEAILDGHRDQWRRTSRLGGLDDSCAHYERILRELTA